MRVQETRPRETVGAARASSVPNPWSPDQALFFKEGEYWTLGYAGHLCRVKDRQGMAHLAQLPRSPGTQHHALDLGRGSVTGFLTGTDAAAAAAPPAQHRAPHL